MNKKFIFIFSFIINSSILYFIFSSDIIKEAIINQHIRLISYLYGFFGLVPNIANNAIIVNKVYLFMIFECTGLPIYILFTSAILAFPTAKENKIKGLLAGIPILFLLNIVRLISVGFVAAFYASFLNLFHNIIWSSSYFLFFILGWVLWLNIINKNEQTA
jgi:exosortase/archaeosortase family protein